MVLTVALAKPTNVRSAAITAGGTVDIGPRSDVDQSLQRWRDIDCDFNQQLAHKKASCEEDAVGGQGSDSQRITLSRFLHRGNFDAGRELATIRCE